MDLEGQRGKGRRYVVTQLNKLKFWEEEERNFWLEEEEEVFGIGRGEVLGRERGEVL